MGTWACGFTVNGAGNVVPWPAESEDKSFVLPDGDTLIGDWHVSKERSEAGEVPMDVKSHGQISLVVMPTSWTVNHFPGSAPGVSSDIFLFCPIADAQQAEPPTTETLAEAHDEEDQDGDEHKFLNVNQVPMWQ